MLKKYWIEILCSLGVLFGVMGLTVEKPLSTGVSFYFWSIFLVTLWFSAVYEITVKRGINERLNKKIVLLNIIFFWVIPLLVGYVIGAHLRV